MPRITSALCCALAAAAVAVAACGCGPVSQAPTAGRPAARTGQSPARPPAPGNGGPVAPARAARAVQPAAGACPVPPRGLLSAAPGGGRTVALTFDDGPGRSTPAVLAILRRYRVPATFFNIGRNIAARPGLVRQEAAAGYALGDHTWNHPHMRALTAAAQLAQITRTAAEQRRVVGTVPCLFRPPFGEYDAATLALAGQQRMAVWQWSVDTQDWMANGSGSPGWVTRIQRRAESGAAQQHPVILMHNQVRGDPATVAALPAIIRFYQSRGYRFVTL